MTRDEAEKNLAGIKVPRDINGRYFIIDVLEALDVLKLDEPKGPEQRLFDDLKRRLPFTFDAIYLRYALEDTGLQIVEKD